MMDEYYDIPEARGDEDQVWAMQEIESYTEPAPPEDPFKVALNYQHDIAAYKKRLHELQTEMDEVDDALAYTEDEYNMWLATQVDNRIFESTNQEEKPE